MPEEKKDECIKQEYAMHTLMLMHREGDAEQMIFAGVISNVETCFLNNKHYINITCSSYTSLADLFVNSQSIQNGETVMYGKISRIRLFTHRNYAGILLRMK